MDFLYTSNLYPAAICLSFYVTVFALAEFSRKIVEKAINHGSVPYIFFMELIATSQHCTCVYENIIMVKHYGIPAFFFTVICILFAGGIFNRGAFVSPLGPIESYWYGRVRLEKLIVILSAEALGGYSAYRIANSLWYYSLYLSDDHSWLYGSLPCAFVYKVPFVAVIFYEIVGCFLMRTIISKLSVDYKPYLVPAVVSFFLSVAIEFIGVPGLNPVITSSRMFGCKGLSTELFIFTYWMCPVIGWMLAARFEHKKLLGSSKKGK